MITAKLFRLSLFGAAVTVATAALGQTAGDGGRKFSTPMSGAEECGATGCGVGDPDGTGTGSITVNVGQDRVCWEFTHSNIVVPHRGHIHQAPAGSNGGIVVDFFNGTPGVEGPLTGCTTAPLGKDLLNDIIQNPSSYYLNLHNEPFPAGAIRGQLEKK